MTIVQTLILRFNAFTGQIEDAYWRSTVHGVQTQIGGAMTAKAAFAYLAAHPKTRCEALRT